MKIGILGGTFDPIHLGHTGLGVRFAEELSLDRVLIIPTRTPPHKDASATPAGMRLAMCGLAAADVNKTLKNEIFLPNDTELERGGKSYTSDTLLELRRDYPGAKMFLLMGADMFVTLEKWHGFGSLREQAVFCALPRDDISAGQLREHAGHLCTLGCETVIIGERMMDISSTEIRRRVREGLSVDDMVTPSVAKYISENMLYKSGE